jgi:hypothetical protein
MWKYLICAMMAAVVVGCGSEAQEKMGGAAPAPWPEAEALDQVLMGVGYPAEMGDWNAVKDAATSPEFEAAINGLASGPTPEGRDEAKKTACVDAFKAFVEAAKSGSKDDLKAKYDAAMSSLKGLRS